MFKKTLCILTLATSPGWVFAGPEAMTADEARHLISRTGYGAAPHEVSALIGTSRAEGVAEIIAGLSTAPQTPMPAWATGWAYPTEEIWTLGQTAEELFFARRWIEMQELTQWWLAEMIATPSPLTERMTFFWHDHFATSFEGVENSQWMAKQNAFFRAQAAGNFANLAHGILQDPAMLVYLTNVENTKEAPNENLGREFLELFTLGEGRGYTEADIKEAARALTGHSISWFGAQTYAFFPEDHDGGRKTILGKTGRFGAADLADIALQDPAFGPYIVEKLWREFISDQPDPAEVARLASLWKQENLEIKPLLTALFMTDAFWDPANRGRIVKSPVELIVGTARSLGTEIPNLSHAVWVLEDMGQSPFLPPNVGGWPGGTAWINDATASTRATVLTEFLDLDAEAYERGSPNGMMQMSEGSDVAMALTRPGDLRVGQVFVTEAEQIAGPGTIGSFVTLYDVGFDGHHWRSISLWVEQEEAGEPPYVALNTADCAPDCLPGWPTYEDEPHWHTLLPGEEALEDVTPSDADMALLKAILGHLPALAQQSENQLIWQSDEEDVAPFSDLIHAVHAASDEAREVFGPPDGALVMAITSKGDFGLAGVDTARLDNDSFDEMLEGYEEAIAYTGQPARTYASAADWLAALPQQGTPSAQAEQALLAIPLPEEGKRNEMFVADPEALIRSLVLSPYFQLN